MPSLCGGKGKECILCACEGFCLAGNGDDDFCYDTKDEIYLRLSDLLCGIPQKYGTRQDYVEESINVILDYIGISKETAKKIISKHKRPYSELYKLKESHYNFREKYKEEIKNLPIDDL